MQARATAVGLILLLLVLSGGAALRESVTSDEVAHIGAGLSYLQRLDMRMNEEHPPLAKVLAAIPLALRGARADYASPAWSLSADFAQATLGEWVFGDYVLTRWNEPAATLAWARLPLLLLTAGLGWLIFVLARRLGGDWGGLLSLTVYVGNPVFLAFGPLVVTDVAIAFFFLLTLWRMAALWDEPSGANTRRLALALAGAILSKFTAPLLFFVFLAAALTARWRPLAGGPPWRAMGRATLWAAVLVYGCYFVLSWSQPMDIPVLAGGGAAGAALGRLLMPAWLVLRGLAWVVITGDRPRFLLGQAYPHGVWFYFPVLLALKSAPGFLGLLALGGGIAVVERQSPGVVPRAHTTFWRFLWVGLALYVAICLVSRMNIGIRHFSVPLVLMMLLLAPLPRLLTRLPTHIPRFAVAVLAVSCLVTVVRAYPFYIPYLSPFGFGLPSYWLVNDSNLDWNQGLPEVASFARRQGLRDVPLDMYGFSGAASLVPQARIWDCQSPSDADGGLHAVVSANMILDAHNCVWLMNYPYERLAGGSMYAVQLPPVIPPPGTPGGPPQAGSRQIFMRAPFDIRHLLQRLVQRPEEIPRVLAEIQERIGRH